MSYEHIKVKLHGKELVWLKKEDGQGPLAPMEHVDSDLELRHDCFLEDSYAHVCAGGIIKRYHKQIGTVDDLEFIA